MVLNLEFGRVFSNWPLPTGEKLTFVSVSYTRQL